MPDLHVSEQQLFFVTFKKKSQLRFNKGTANLQNIHMSKASSLRRGFRSEKLYQTQWDLSSQLKGDILDCTESKHSLQVAKFPWSPVSGCQHKGTSGPFQTDVQTSAFLDIKWTILVPVVWADCCCKCSVLRRAGILAFGFYCKLGEWCWKTLLASENTLTRSHVAYKIPFAFRSSWQASFRLEYCCVTFPRTSGAEIFDKKTKAQHQGLPCSWIFHVFVWKMLGSKTLSLSVL